MKAYVFLVFILFSVLACSNNGNSKNVEQDESLASDTSAEKSKKSIPVEAKKWVGNTNIKINYNAPSVRGRQIWGALVPYDRIWVTGAHSATSLEIGKDFRVADKTLPAGRYALFTIPGKHEWTVILNKKWDQHLTDDYSENEDVIRFNVKPDLREKIQERLKYKIDQTGERRANIIMTWEKMKISFPLEIY